MSEPAPVTSSSTFATGVPSTSTSAPGQVTQSTQDSTEHESEASMSSTRRSGALKRKKLPACDSCKLRRVLCVPVAPPGSCGRCMEKDTGDSEETNGQDWKADRGSKVSNVVFTKSQKLRAILDVLRAMFGTADPNSPSLFAQPENQPWLASTSLASTSAIPHVSPDDIDSRLGLSQLSGDLVAHLLSLYQALPQSWLPLLPRGRLSVLFESVGRQLSSLSPQAEVLAHTIIALTCRLSSHPYIIGPGSPAPSFDALTGQHLKDKPDLREFGKRREEVCNKLRIKAVRLAWERGTLVETSEETMACCHLLEVLESRKSQRGGVPYSSAFVSHLRTMIAEKDEPGKGKIQHQPLGWSALMLREATAALSIGRSPNFTEEDDKQLCGEGSPPSIEESLLETVDDVDLRDSITLFFRPMRPYCFHASRLARECASVTGTFARKRPLDETFVSIYLAQVDSLERLLLLLTDRITFMLSPAATSAHALPQPFENERRYVMLACIHTLELAWASLLLPLYNDLKRRLGLFQDATTLTERRTRDRLQVLLRHAQETTLRGAARVAGCVARAPSLGFLTHLQQERLESWVAVLLEAPSMEEDGTGICREERTQHLHTILAGMKTMGWSWPDNDELIDTLEARLQSMHVEGPGRSAVISSNQNFDLGNEGPDRPDDTTADGPQSNLTSTPTFATPMSNSNVSTASSNSSTQLTGSSSNSNYLSFFPNQNFGLSGVGSGQDSFFAGLLPPASLTSSSSISNSLSALSPEASASLIQQFGGIDSARELASSFGIDFDALYNASPLGPTSTDINPLAEALASHASREINSGVNVPASIDDATAAGGLQSSNTITASSFDRDSISVDAWMNL